MTWLSIIYIKISLTVKTLNTIIEVCDGFEKVSQFFMQMTNQKKY